MIIKKTNDKGFTLLEILIAVAILASSILALSSLQASSYLSSERGELLSRATLLAQEKMTEFEIEIEKDMKRNKFPSEAENSGVFDEPFEDFRWKTLLKKVEIPVLESGGDSEESKNIFILNYLKNISKQISESVREVQVTVLWGDKDLPEDEQPQMSLTTHIVKLN